MSEVDRKKLLDVLTAVKPSLSSQDHIPVMTHFCFTKNRVHAYNEISAISEELPTDLECAVHGQSLLDYVSNMSSKKVSIYVEGDSFIVRPTRGRSFGRFPYLPKKEFLYTERTRDQWRDVCRVDAHFVDGMKKTLISVGEGTYRLSLMGVTLSAKDNALFSTDNKTLSRFRLKRKLPARVKRTVLPRFFCQQIEPLHKRHPKKPLTLAMSGDFVVVHNRGRVLLYCSLFSSGTADDLGKIFTETLPKAPRFFEKPKNLEGALERALVVIRNEQKKIVSLSFDGDRRLIVRAKSPLGESKDTLLLSPGASVDGKYHTEAEVLLRAVKECSRVVFTDQVAAFQDGDDFVHMVEYVTV